MPRSLHRRAESRVAESIAAGDPKNTTKLLDLISTELENSDALPTMLEIRNKTGFVVTRRTRHFTYFTACMLNHDAEVVLAHFAASDNAHTLAGNRRDMAKAASVPARPADAADSDFDAAITNGENPGSPGVPIATSSGAPTPTEPSDTLEPSGPSNQDALFSAQTDGPDWFEHPVEAETFEDQPDPGTQEPDDGGSFENPLRRNGTCRRC